MRTDPLASCSRLPDGLTSASLNQLGEAWLSATSGEHGLSAALQRLTCAERASAAARRARAVTGSSS